MKQGLTVLSAVVSLCSYQFYIVWYLWHSIKSDKRIWHCQAIAAALSCNQSTFSGSMGFVVLYTKCYEFPRPLSPTFFLSQWRDAGHTFVELVISIPGSSLVSFGFSAAGDKRAFGTF